MITQFSILLRCDLTINQSFVSHQSFSIFSGNEIFCFRSLEGARNELSIRNKKIVSHMLGALSEKELVPGCIQEI